VPVGLAPPDKVAVSVAWTPTTTAAGETTVEMVGEVGSDGDAGSGGDGGLEDGVGVVNELALTTIVGISMLLVVVEAVVVETEETDTADAVVEEALDVVDSDEVEATDTVDALELDASAWLLDVAESKVVESMLIMGAGDTSPFVVEVALSNGEMCARARVRVEP
jgi:hypothetical protein